jgi:hypothetical protein
MIIKIEMENEFIVISWFLLKMILDIHCKTFENQRFTSLHLIFKRLDFPFLLCIFINNQKNSYQQFGIPEIRESNIIRGEIKG